jgi:DNA-binding transcriptional LysR family regulator
LRKAAVAGLGTVLLTRTVVRQDLNEGRLVPVLPAFQCRGFGLYALYPSRHHLPLSVSAFIDRVVDKLGALDAIAATSLSGLGDTPPAPFSVGRT